MVLRGTRANEGDPMQLPCRVGSAAAERVCGSYPPLGMIEEPGGGGGGKGLLVCGSVKAIEGEHQGKEGGAV